MGEYGTFLAKIEEYEADLQAEFPLSSHLPTQDNLRVVAKLVEHEITKYYHGDILFSAKRTCKVSLILQDEKAQESHFDSMARALSKLYAIFTNLSGYAGPTLKKRLRTSFGVIFASVKNVVLEFQLLEQDKDKENGKDVKIENGDKGKQKEEETSKKGATEVKLFDPKAVGRMPTTQLVGVVWEYARNLGEISISNHIAIAQEMKGIAQLLQDAHEEVQALAQSADSADDEFEDEELNTEERERVGPVTQFAKANFTLVDRVAQKLAETAPSNIEAEQGVVGKLEETLRLADQISKYTDEICSCMYPPQDVDALHTNTRELRRHVELFLDVIVTLDKEIPRLNAQKLVVVVRTLVGNLTGKICTDKDKP